MLILALSAFGLTLAVSPAVLIGLRRLGVLDVPSHRSSHDDPTPRGGGLAVGIGAVTGLLLAASVPDRAVTGVLVAACGLGIVGLIDDFVDVPAVWRLFLQVVAAASSVVWLLEPSGRGRMVGVALACLAVLWIVSYVNAFNFMDGINGLSVAQVVVVGGAWILLGEARDFRTLSVLGLVLTAAAAAFAPFNFPRARMFLGDSGSYFIGGWLAAGVLLGLGAGLPPEAVGAPLALYLADTGTTLARRVWRGETWHAAHREHAYQRLTDLSWSHTATTVAVGGVLVVVTALGQLSLTGSLALRVAGDVAALCVLAAYLRAPVWLARLRVVREVRAA